MRNGSCTTGSSVGALVLADARFPGGGHAHSGGSEEAAFRGMIDEPPDLRSFLLGRLRTAGALQAVFAAAAAHLALRGSSRGHWAELDVELDARTPSPAQRAASRVLGKGTARAGRSAWPSRALDALVDTCPRPHHPIVLGVLSAATGGGPRNAALTAAYLAISGPSTAGVRLLGLDPITVNAVVAGLGEVVDDVADDAVRSAGLPPAELPAPGSPALDLFAEEHDRHHREEGRLFAS